MLIWTWICSCLYDIVFSVSSDIFPEMEILGQMVVLVSTFWRTFKLFSIVCAPTYISTSSAWRVPFLHILSSIYYLFSFWWQHWWSGEVIYCGFDMHFFYDYWFWASFDICVCLSCIFYGTCLFRSFIHFLIRLFGFVGEFLLLSCISSLFWILTPDEIQALQMFSTIPQTVISFCWSFLLLFRGFQLDVVNYFWFCFLCFRCHIQNIVDKIHVMELTTCFLMQILSFGLCILVFNVFWVNFCWVM